MTSIKGFNDLLSWADGLSAVMAERKRGDLVKQIEEAKAALAANTFTLAVLGKAKRGKSTLINALLGRNDDALAPIDKLPASSAITRFRFCDEEAATVLFQNGNREALPYSRIREFVTEESNPGNKKEVAMLEVAGPFPNLPRQTELVDTPGAGSIHEHHDALLHAFIPQADAVIFLVTARMPLDQEEIELLKELKRCDIDKIFFVVNKKDESEPDEMDSAIAHNRKLLGQCGITPEGFHQISAKYAYLGKAGSLVPELAADINSFLAKHKGAVIRQRFLSKVNGIVESELRSIEVAYASGSKSVEQLDAEIADFQRERRKIVNKREQQEKEFARKWNDAANDFASKLGKAEKDVSAAVTEKTESAGTLGVSKLAKELPTFLNQTISDTLTPITSRFETTARAACDELNSEYPILANDETGRIVFKAPKDTLVAKTLLGGGALAAGGVGLASAGVATAAGIAAANTAALAGVASLTATATAAAASAATTAAWMGLGGGALVASAPALLAVPVVGPVLAGGAGIIGAGLTGAASLMAPAAVTVAAPTLLSAPIWLAFAGPVGWTLAGVAALAVPFSWRVSKLKQKDKLEDEAQKQVKSVFEGIRNDRVAALRNMGTSILDGFKNKLDYKIKELEDALNDAKAHRPGDAELDALKRQSAAVGQLIAQGVEWMGATP